MAQSSPTKGGRAYWMLGILVTLTIIIYFPVYRYGFIAFDDPDYVVQNFHVQGGFNRADIHFAFTTYKMGNWNPLLWISFYVDRTLFRLRPGAMHVENVLLHLAAGLILWRVLRIVTGSLIRSFIVAGLFLVHPMHVESVVWISERKDVLSTSLLFAAILSYVDYCRAAASVRGRAAYASTILLFFLSLAAKPMGVTLPALLMVLDYWPLGRLDRQTWKRRVTEKLPMFIISAVFMTLTKHAQWVTGSETSFEALSFSNRIDNAIVCYILYLRKLVWPTGLSVFYLHPGARTIKSVVASGLLILLISCCCIKVRARKPYLLVGWLWFVGTLLPVIGLIQVGGQAMADRYSYLPSVGLFVTLVWAMGDFVNQVQLKAAIACLVMVAFTIIASVQVHYWRDSEALFSHAVELADDNPPAHNVLAHLAMERKDLKRAIGECNLALKYGDNARAYDQLGECVESEDRSQALGYYKKAVALDPDVPGFWVDLSRALRREGFSEEARRAIDRGLTLEPDNANGLQELKLIQTAK